nr:hypothetical protein [Tanacetum cinerariifolium]
ADYPSHAYKLKKTLYGLKQALRAWYDKLSTFLLQNGFSKGTIDLTLFTRCFDDDILVVQVYVEHHYPYHRHRRFDDDILVSKYVHAILKKYGLNTFYIVGTPMDIKDKLDLDQIGTPVDATKYRSMIGALMYLTSSRPDIVHATCVCARYQAHPTKKHLKEVKRIFRYLQGTVNMGLWYTKDTGFELTGFSDADYAGCKDTFKSTSGGAQFLGEKLVSKPDLSYLHVFGALCNPNNDSEDLGKLQAKAHICIFIGYAPKKKAYRIYNRRTQKIIETIHVDFDELTAMASEQLGSGPGLQSMTLATSSSGLAIHEPGGNLERDVHVGNDDTLLCWIDDGPLKAKFTRLFTLVENKQVTVFDKIHNGFHFGFKRTPRGHVESMQMDELTNKISMVAFSEDHDRWLWSLDDSSVVGASCFRLYSYQDWLNWLEELKIMREMKDYLEAMGSLYDLIVHYAFVWSNARERAATVATNARQSKGKLHGIFLATSFIPQGVTKCSGTKSDKQDTSSRSENDTHAEDVDIKLVNEKEPMAEVDRNTTPDSTNMCHKGGEIDQNAKNISKGYRISLNKSSAVHEKPNTLRSCLRKKPTGRIFKTDGLRWIPTGKMFTDSTTNVDNEPPNGLNKDITNPYECKQTLNVSAGLVTNPIPQQPCNPPKRDDWDRLLQPMFDEYFSPPTIAVSPVPVVVAPRAIDLADSPTRLLKSSSNVRPIHTPFKSLVRWTKDHPIANVIKDPSRSVSTSKQLQTDAMWCYFDAFLTSVEPKNFKQAMTKPSWIDAMQEEIHKFERLQV